MRPTTESPSRTLKSKAADGGEAEPGEELTQSGAELCVYVYMYIYIYICFSGSGLVLSGILMRKPRL